jgi:hypothetical protein
MEPTGQEADGAVDEEDSGAAVPSHDLLAGTRYGGLPLGARLRGGAELEVPLYFVARDTDRDAEGGQVADRNSLVVAPLRDLPRFAGAEAGRDRIAALYDRALRLAHVEHPALPALVESMAPELPEPFLAWALPPGESVRALLDRHAPELARAARIAAGVASALEALHAAGEVHGGLCPANVLLRGDGTGGADEVQLLGVGLASTLTAAAALPPEVARYRAPEQLSFSRGAIGPRTDLFALGALLYELVNAEPAFPGRTLGEVRDGMAAGPPDSVAFHFAGSGGALPEPLDRAIRGALHPDPAQRFRTVAELARCLEELLDLLEPGRRPLRSPGDARAQPRPRTSASSPVPRGVLDRRRELAHASAPIPLALWLVPGALLLALVVILALRLF